MDSQCGTLRILRLLPDFRNLTFRGSCVLIYFYYKKPTRSAVPQVYFDKELCMFRKDLLFIIRSLNTVYTTIGTCHVVMLTVNITSMTSTYCCVYSVETPDDGQ